jgi:hypothetical protein
LGQNTLNKDGFENKHESLELSRELLFEPLEDYLLEETRTRAEFTQSNNSDEAFLVTQIDDTEK